MTDNLKRLRSVSPAYIEAKDSAVRAKSFRAYATADLNVRAQQSADHAYMRRKAMEASNGMDGISRFMCRVFPT